MNLLKNKNFLLILTGWNVSNLGTLVQNFAFSLFVLTTTGSAAQFSLALSLEVLPQILLTPFSGYFADRFNRKKMIIICDMLSAATLLLIFLSYVSKGTLYLYEIYITVFLLAAIGSFFSPVATCLFQNIVRDEEIAKARSVNSTLGNIVNVFAPILAGILFGFTGIKAVILINCLSFLISAIAESFLDTKTINSVEVSSKENGFKESIKEGFSFVIKEKFIKSFLFSLSMLNFMLPTVTIGITTVANNQLRLSPSQIGTIDGALSIGMILGSILSGILLSRKGSNNLNFLVALSIFVIMAMFSFSGLWLSFIYSYLSTLQNASILVILNILIIIAVVLLQINLSVQFQKIVPNEIMGRVSSFVNGVLTACVPLGQIIIGLMFQYLNYSTVFFIEGFLALILFIITKSSEKKTSVSDIIA